VARIGLLDGVCGKKANGVDALLCEIGRHTPSLVGLLCA
jgi:hypothetical protein